MADKPELTSNTSRTYTVIEDEKAVLQCILVDANPKKGIVWKWFKTDEPGTVLSDGPRFTIQNIRRQNFGSYKCTAENTAGTSDAIEIVVVVQCKYLNKIML